MTFVGIDSSTTNTAFVVLDSDKNLVDYTLFTSKDKDILHRSEFMIRSVLNTLSNFSPHDTSVGIEAASFNSVGRRDKLTMLLGGIYYGARMMGFTVTLLPPQTIKKQYTGNGRADKEEMISATPSIILKDFFSISKKVDDLVDAYAIAKCL